MNKHDARSPLRFGMAVVAAVALCAGCTDPITEYRAPPPDRPAEQEATAGDANVVETADTVAGEAVDDATGTQAEAPQGDADVVETAADAPIGETVDDAAGAQAQASQDDANVVETAADAVAGETVDDAAGAQTQTSQDAA